MYILNNLIAAPDYCIRNYIKLQIF